MDKLTAQECVMLLQSQLTNASAQEILKVVLSQFGDRLVIASSLGLEDQVITHMACQLFSQVRIFVLQTGRLHKETLAVMDATQKKYGFTYEVMTPDSNAVSELVKAKGEFSFYDSIENRKECCYIRKVEPLRRILATSDAWVTGQRSEQSPTRVQLLPIEWDDANQKIKVNPLADWTQDQLNMYIKQHELPYNVLHDRGYPSIGCEPCTRAVKPGEDIRSGRWWWESADQKECGLHSSK